MEENENQTTNVENVENTVNSEVNNTETTNANNIVETLKSKKNLIVGVVICLVVILCVYNVFFNTKGKAKNVVIDYYKALNKGKAKKMLKTVDMAGVYVFSELDDDEYEDFWAEYKEYVDSDEYKEAKEEYDEALDENIEDLEDLLSDSETTIKVKKVKEVKKVASHLYKVKVQLESKDEDGDKSQKTVTHYVMKKGLKCYIVDVKSMF